MNSRPNLRALLKKKPAEWTVQELKPLIKSMRNHEFFSKIEKFDISLISFLKAGRFEFLRPIEKLNLTQSMFFVYSGGVNLFIKEDPSKPFINRGNTSDSEWLYFEKQVKVKQKINKVKKENKNGSMDSIDDKIDPNMFKGPQRNISKMQSQKPGKRLSEDNITGSSGAHHLPTKQKIEVNDEPSSESG